MPRILANTKDMPREEWLKLRRTGLGGSDAGTICGLNPYSSKIELWADKTGRLPDKEDNEAMRTGRDLEEYVARRFCEETGKKVRRRNATFCHDNYDFIRLECKTTSAFAKSDFENGEIPRYYYCQCMHYMNVMGFEKMYLAVLVMGRAFYWFEIPFDKSEAEALLKLEIEFWNDHIIPDVRPAPDGSDSAKNVLDMLFKEREENTITMFEQEKTAWELASIQAQKKIIENREKVLKNTLINALEKNAYGITENYEIAYTARNSTRVDSKKLKSEFPDVYAKVCKETSANYFTIKERKL